MPEETEILALASELGALSLSLRNEEDADAIEERSRATVQTLLSGERMKATQRARQQMVKIIRGEGSAGFSLGAQDAP
jgi:pilus assembly protein CpaB